MHPELKNIGWDTVLTKGQVYNNCELAYSGLNGYTLILNTVLAVTGVRMEIKCE